MLSHFLTTFQVHNDLFQRKKADTQKGDLPDSFQGNSFQSTVTFSKTSYGTPHATPDPLLLNGYTCNVNLYVPDAADTGNE